MKMKMKLIATLLLLVMNFVAIARGQKCSKREGSVLVIATHPDDELICCSGIISRAISNSYCIRIIILSNGEYFGNGVLRGLQRQRESVEGLASLGVDEENIVFLGYPDSYLYLLFTNYSAVDTDTGLRTRHGINETYGSRGYGKADYHFVKKGSHAPLNFKSLLWDLTEAIKEFSPTHVFVSATNMDAHKDHKTTYQASLLALTKETLSPLAVIHSMTVWNNEINWPNHINVKTRIIQTPKPGKPFIDIPERIEVPPSMLESTNWSLNLKYKAISKHESQSGHECSFIHRFIHRDELFWIRPIEEGGIEPPIPDAGDDQFVCPGEKVILDGTRSFDSEEELQFSWRQSFGPQVELQGSKTSRPTFLTPPKINEKVILEFEMIITNKHGIRSFPDSVIINVLSFDEKAPGINVARNATVTASSENYFGRQLATNAIDGVVDGLLRISPKPFGDGSKEWKTSTGSIGAWIELHWQTPMFIDRVVFYDSVSCRSHIIGGVIQFSDNSSAIVGELENMGTATTVFFSPKLVSSLRFTITKAIFDSTWDVGLAEIEVFSTSSELFCTAENQQQQREQKPYIQPLSERTNKLLPRPKQQQQQHISIKLPDSTTQVIMQIGFFLFMCSFIVSVIILLVKILQRYRRNFVIFQQETHFHYV